MTPPFGTGGEFPGGGGGGGGGSSAPSGPAGGVLAGTYPNPTLSTTASGTTQSAGDTSTKLATDAFVSTAITNALAAINPAVAVLLATTAAADTSSLTYANGASGVGATFTGAVNTALTFDGTALTALGQRVLVKNDTQSPSGAFNGVYFLSQLQTSLLAPILTRALDYDQPSDITNTGAIPVQSGTANAGSSWLLTTAVTTVGTSPLTYTQFTSPVPASVVTGLTTDTQIKIHGMSANADRLPASVNANGANNDEFDENSAGAPTGWTTFQSPAICNTSDIPSNLHLQSGLSGGTGGSQVGMSGIYKIISGNLTFPFTMTMKLTDACLPVNYTRAGLFVSIGVPGTSGNRIYMVGFTGAANLLATGNYFTDYNNYNTGIGNVVPMSIPCYLRIIALNSTQITFAYSYNGLTWALGETAPYTPFNPITHVGICVAPQNANQPAELACDWIRFS